MKRNFLLFLRILILTYYHGGLDDMAIHINLEWSNGIELIEKYKIRHQNLEKTQIIK